MLRRQVKVMKPEFESQVEDMHLGVGVDCLEARMRSPWEETNGDKRSTLMKGPLRSALPSSLLPQQEADILMVEELALMLALFQMAGLSQV